LPREESASEINHLWISRADRFLSSWPNRLDGEWSVRRTDDVCCWGCFSQERSKSGLMLFGFRTSSWKVFWKWYNFL